jgi:uncharacterized protein YciI
MSTPAALLACATLLCLSIGASAQPASAPASALYDPALAKSLGADERGMRQYVLVILRSGPHKVPAGPARDAMFKGHFANIERLASAGQLALAGPFDSAQGWRGLFILAVPDVVSAQALVATDPVIIAGEMVADYHPFYGSAALMLVNEAHNRISKKPL